LTILYLAGAKNTDNCAHVRGICSVIFLWIVQMILSSSITAAADGEHLMCGGFSLDEPVCLGNFDFIIDYFGSLSISPRRGNEGAVFVGLTRSGVSTPHQATIEDSTEEFLTMSSREGSFSHPSPRWCSTGGLLCPHYNNMEGERSNHGGVSPTDGGATVGNHLPL
jgi:hypothetical protein